MKKRAVVLLAAGMLAAVSFTGCASSLKDSDVVVAVGDKKITADIANFYARYTQAQYETQFAGYLGDDMWNTEATEGKTYEESVKDSVLDQLEQMIVLEQHMDEYDVKLSEEEKKLIDKSAADFDEANGLEEKEKISGELKTVKRMFTLMAIRNKMSTAIQAGTDTEVSDEEAAQKSMQYVLFSYKSTDEDGNSTDLSDEEKADVKTKAESFAEGIKSAEDFAAYATEQGQETKTATFDKDAASPDADLVKAADALGEGEYTGVIETDSGCYVAKVTSLLDRAATDTKKEQIVQQRKSDLFTDTCDKWLKDEKVKVHKSVWKKVDFNEFGITMKQEESDPYADEVQTDDQADANSGGDADLVD